MTDEAAGGSDEVQLRALIEERSRAIRAKDVAAILAPYAPDVLSYDLVDPLRQTGRDAIARRLEQWFSQFHDGPIGFETRDLQLVAGGDAAFCHGLNHVDAITKDGRPIRMWWRATSGFRKVDGRWRVVHEHASVPFDMETGRASMDLEP